MCQKGGELWEFYDSAGIEGVAEGNGGWKGMHYYMMRLTYQEGDGTGWNLVELESGEVVVGGREFRNLNRVKKAKELSVGLEN